jgi:glutamate N-acetyltransferase/amino-acid N-acetyltransferase
MFTTNAVKGASLLVTREHVAAGSLHAIVANSGNANTCTGDAGVEAARRTAALIADEFAVSPKSVAVASTGVIGVPLPMSAIESEISSLADSLCGDAAGHNAALEAIMTTDTRKKDGAIEIDLSGVPVRIGAMTKGSGMIHPNMATMLCFITTDADVSREMLEKALRRAVGHSFNRLTVDGDMSTNDMTLILANGAAGNPPVTTENEDFTVFSDALESLCISLARKMARDGEGATRLLTVAVRGAKDEICAETLAKSVAASSLMKAAIFGADANWGRALCALGYAGVDFDPEKVDVSFASRAGSVLVCKDSHAAQFSEEEAKRILSEEEVEINIDLTGGASGAAVVWGCDLTYEYIKINGEYRS